jgi:uncharacterized protein
MNEERRGGRVTGGRGRKQDDVGAPARSFRIRAGEVEMLAVLNDSRTAEAIWEALPIQAKGNRWGDEIYFSIPLALEPEDPREVVERGDLDYWPPGNAFCIFFGPTPMSSGDEVRPASPVNVFGHLEGDPTILKRVPNGARVAISRQET